MSGKGDGHRHSLASSLLIPLPQGIQFVKHLQKLADKAKQRAEVSMYFKRFDEAEQSYHKMDRPDLAIDMRMRLGEMIRG